MRIVPLALVLFASACMDYDLNNPGTFPDDGAKTDTGEVGYPDDDEPSDDNDPGDLIDVQELEHRWIGEYTCLQGLTAFELIFEMQDSDDLWSVFSFWASEYNPGVPTGSFSMRGSFDGATGYIEMDPVGWVEQPDGYVMVGLWGYYDPDALTIEGEITGGTNCTTFHLDRE